MKHEYAFTNTGKIVSVRDSFKNVMGIRYYYDPSLTCEMILRDGEINTKHFAIKSNSILNINGVEFSPSRINESPAHYNFKMKVLQDGFFRFMNYKIFIQKAKVEFIESEFRYDLKSELMCGTPCVIEVIRSSKTSAKKESYLRENQILTFEIYLEKNGNQDLKQFNLYGNSELEQLIKSRVEFKQRVDAIQRNMYYRKELAKREILSEPDARREKLESKVFAIRRNVLDIEKQIREFRDNSETKYNEVEQAISVCRNIKGQVTEAERIGKGKHTIFAEIERIEEEILRTSNRIRQSEFEFEQTSKNCRIEWFTPKWIEPVNTLSNFKYWTT
jgi:hypothetical protein